MSDVSEEDIEFYQGRYGDGAPILLDELDHFLYDVWVISRSNGMYGGAISDITCFEVADDHNIDRIGLLRIIRRIEGEFSELNKS